MIVNLSLLVKFISDKEDSMDFLQSSSKNFEEIKEHLENHVTNKFLFRKDQVTAYHGSHFGDGINWSSKNMRRVHFSNCVFTNVNFKSTGFTGSIFKSCNFKESNLDCAIFDECIFIDCEFSDMNLHSASFCKVEMVDCRMDNLCLDSCFFTDSIWNNVLLTSCKIIDIIWENAKFLKCTFDTVELLKLNFEFTHFYDICFKETILPFASLPFVFGGIKYLLNTNDDVWIKTVSPDFPDAKLPKEEYINLLPEFLEFYTTTTNYFPVANILLGYGKINDGVDSILSGLEFWFNIHNYKMMHYLCELANTYNLDITHRKIIYKHIQKLNERMLVHEEDIGSQNRWSTYQAKMRESLLDSASLPYVTLEFETCIKQNDYDHLSEFMQNFDNLLPTNSYSSVELRHNSPYNIMCKIFGDETTLITIVVSILTICNTCVNIRNTYFQSKKTKKEMDSSKKKESESIAPFINNVTYNYYNFSTNYNALPYFTKQSNDCFNTDSSNSNQ